MADGFVRVNQAPADFGDLGEGASRTNEFGTYPVESPERRVERSKTQLAILKTELAQAKTDEEALSIGKEIQNATAIAQAPQNRGSRIATEVKGDWKKVNAEGPAAPVASAKDGWVSINQETKKAEPPKSSAVGEVVSGLKRGALGQFPQMIGQAFKWMGEEPKPIEQGGRGSTLYEIGQSLENTGAEYLDNPANKANPEAHNWLTNALASGAEMVVPSVAPLAISALLPESLPAWVSMGLGATSMSWLYGGSQAQQTYEKAIKAGIPREKAREAGIETGAIEAGGEIVGTAALGYLFGSVGKAIGKASGMSPVEGVFEAVKNPSYFTSFAKKLPAVYGTEIGTEMGQNAGEAAVEQAHGIPQGEQGGPWEQAKQAIAPTFGMTTLLLPFGLVGHGIQAHQTTMAAGALQNPESPKEVRNAAAEAVGAALKSEDKAFGEQWLAKAKEAIAAGAPVGLDREFAGAPIEPSVPLSPLEQARVDGQQLKETGALPDDIQKDGERFQNAQLVAVYGENAAVNKVIEHPELTGSLKQAMLDAAPAVERVRAKLSANEQNRDITPDIVAAIDELTTIRASGKTVAQVMAHGHPGDASYEAQQLMQFLDENLDNPQMLSKFMEDYLRIVETMGGVPSEVRGRAFDIIHERKSGREMEEGRHLLEQMEKKRTEDEAYAKREFDAQKRDLEIKRLKDEDRKRTQESVRSDRAEKIASELRRKAAVAKPEERTAMSIAMEKANLKGKDRAKPRPAVAAPVPPGEAKDTQAGAGQAGEPRGAQGLPSSAEAGAASVEQRVREGGATEGAPAAHEPAGRAEQIVLEKKRAEAMGNVEVETNAIEAETGRRVKVKDRADVALKDINHQIKTMEALLECLG